MKLLGKGDNALLDKDGNIILKSPEIECDFRLYENVKTKCCEVYNPKDEQYYSLVSGKEFK